MPAGGARRLVALWKAHAMPVAPAVPLTTETLAEMMERLLGAPPSPETLRIWSERVAAGSSAEAFLGAIAALQQYAAVRRARSVFPAGHYHSPVVDPTMVHDYVVRNRATKPSDIAGIEIPLADMEGFWRRHEAVIAATPFPELPDPRWRYHTAGGPFPLSDAAMLRSMIHVHRPRRIVEIGSGYSTACMLDSADDAALPDLSITCVEPYPQRLLSLMRPGDEERVKVHPHLVQDMPLDVYRSLEANDILFIDSTHVLKTGSDVHFELFYILPLLKPGVIVHFHDCPFPFEYPNKWIFEDNFSWNEAYALRAFLMWNTRFRIYFWGGIFAATYPMLVRQTFPRFFPNPGTSVWLTVQVWPEEARASAASLAG